MKFSFHKRDILFFGVATALTLLYIWRAGGGFALDDSWIHQTFARNFAQTGTWAFIAGVPTAASTSPLYTVLLSFSYRLGVDYALWTHGLGVLTLTLAGILGARIADLMLGEKRHASLLTGLMMIATWHLIWSAASGMETMLFNMLTLWLIYLGLLETQPQARPISQRGLVFGFIAGLTTLARPEGILLAGIIGLMLSLLRPHLTWAGWLQWGLTALLGFFVTLSPYLILNYQLTGGLLPDTAAAKFEQHAILLMKPYVTRFLELTVAILAGSQVLLIPGVIVFVIRQIRQRQWFYLTPILWSVSLIGIYAARLPASYQHGRYVIPALPAFIVCGMVGTIIIWHWGHQQVGVGRREQMWRRISARALGSTLALLAILFGLGIGLNAYVTDVQIINEEMVDTALWIDANLPPDELLAIHDVGAVGFFAPRPELLDIAGLVSPEVIPIVADADALWALMEQRDARYLMAFADQLPGEDPNDPRLCQIYQSNGQASPRAGGYHMTVYRLAWDANCED